MENLQKAVILIGHGGLPADIPKEIVEDFMKLHKARIRSGMPISSKEKELESTIRNWERTPESDPYKSGLEKLASHLAPKLEGFILKTAYNEFCYPSIEQAAHELVNAGVAGVYDALKVRDPIMAKRLKTTDSQRLVRALEVIEAVVLRMIVRVLARVTQMPLAHQAGGIPGLLEQLGKGDLAGRHTPSLAAEGVASGQER